MASVWELISYGKPCRVLSRSVILLQLGSVLVSTARVTTEAVLCCRTSAATLAMGTFKPGSLQRSCHSWRSVNVHGPCCLQRQAGCPGSRPQPVTLLMSEDHDSSRATQISLACTDTQFHAFFLSSAAANGHVCIHGPLTVRV